MLGGGRAGGEGGVGEAIFSSLLLRTLLIGEIYKQIKEKTYIKMITTQSNSDS